MTVISVMGVVLATLVAAPAAGADGGSVVCDPVDAAAPVNVSCTVSGSSGSEFVLVIVVTDAQGAEHVTASSRHSSGNAATFTQSVPHGVTKIVATGLVDGAEVGSKVVADVRSATGGPPALGLPAIAVAVSAITALIWGALMLFFGARTRSVERRGTGAYQGVSS